MFLRQFCIFLCVYLKILEISCEEGATLAFAIDDTASMWNEISQVKKEAKEILNVALAEKSNEIENFVLVTINDPNSILRMKTTSPSIFKPYLDSISINGGGDCEEMSLTGIETALKASGPRSYVFVFTDASAKDYTKADAIKSLCQRKQSQVVFVLTGDCGQPSSKKYSVYYDIAEASSGQVFNVEKNEVHSVLDVVKVILNGKKAINTWRLLSPSSTAKPVQFTIDDKTDYALITVSGKNTEIRITTGNTSVSGYFAPEVHSEKIMWNSNAKVLKMNHPKPGTYYAWVNGKSKISVVVYVRTDITFEHGFSILKPKSMKDTSKQPIAGKAQHVSINVTDPEGLTNMKSVQILNMKEDVINKLPLTKVDKNYYITEPYVSPKHMFKIRIIGEIKKTHQEIRRDSKTAIEPQIIVDPTPATVLNAKIVEGAHLDVDYGATVSLTCKVDSYPAPTIQWFNARGDLIPSESSEVERPTYISYLRLTNVKKTETYVCKVKNNKRGPLSNNIEVAVRPIFKTVSVPPADLGITYGTQDTIRCNIKSSYPTKIKWYWQKDVKSSRNEISPSDKLSISSDGTELKIKFMDLKMDGKYTCEAYLESDPNEKISFHTDVSILGLIYPEFTYATSYVKEKKFTAICRVKGFPKTTISWQFKPKGSEVFHAITGHGENLNIPVLKLYHSGIYKCMASNILGNTERDFNLVVKEKPITTTEGPKVYYGLEGDTVLRIPCNVTGFPDPAIVWRKDDQSIRGGTRYEIRKNGLYINNPIKTDTAKFTFEARNELGAAKEMFETVVKDTFDNDVNFYGPTHTIHAVQGKPVTMKCNIANSESNSVRWYLNGRKISHTGKTWNFEHASMSNDGNYTCRVNTNEGSTSETYVLDVGYPPSFVSDTASPVNIEWNGDKEALDCKVKSKPDAKVKWFHEGKHMPSLNDLQEHHVSDWGEYKCVVNNMHGTVQRTFKVYSDGCYIHEKITTKNMPLISENDDDSPAWPISITNIDLKLDEYDKVKLSCLSGIMSSNSFQTLSSKTEVIAECYKEDKFIVDGKTYKYSDLQCKTEVEPTIMKTTDAYLCSGSDLEEIQVGYEVHGFLEAYKVCYNKSKKAPVFASVYLTTPILERDAPVVAEWNHIPGIGDGKPTAGYTCNKSNKCCYSKGQLAHVDDVVFGPAQAATFKDNLNSVAVWNPCDGSGRMSWQEFEKKIRDMSSDVMLMLSHTGASDYVIKNGGLVPRYLWKVIQHDETTNVAVYVNDPSPVDSDIKCTQPCDLIVNSKDKFLYCCTPEEFSEVFKLPLFVSHPF